MLVRGIRGRGVLEPSKARGLELVISPLLGNAGEGNVNYLRWKITGERAEKITGGGVQVFCK